MVSLAFGIFIYSHFMSSSLAFFENEALNFSVFLIVIAALVGLKLLTMKTFFFVHDQEEIGTMVIDFQYAYNFLLSLILVIVIAADLYFYRLSNSLYITASIVVGILFLMRLMGSILLLLNKFTYPIISLFIYLCAFEIVPMLVIAKVIFVKS